CSPHTNPIPTQHPSPTRRSSDLYSETMTDYDALASLSAVELRDAIAAGTYTARQVTEYYLSQINQHADLGAFMAVHADAALQRRSEEHTSGAQSRFDLACRLLPH